jgi:hypothetical protein
MRCLRNVRRAALYYSQKGINMSVDLIICGDLHISEKNPECRTDDLVETQWKKIGFIRKLADTHNCPVIFPGDVFDKAKMLPKIERKAIIVMPFFIGVPGQHDLPYHHIENYEESSLAVLEAATDSHVLVNDKPIVHNEMAFHGYWWGSPGQQRPLVDGIRNIAIMHRMTWTVTVPYEGCKADSAHKLLASLPNYDLIVTGDNHQHFIVKHNNQILVNCGSVMRREADQVDHKPCVYLYTSSSNTIKRVDIPVRTNVVSRTHLVEKEQRDERRKAYISNLKSNTRPGLNFKRNIENALSNLKDNEVVAMVRKSMSK